VEAISFGCGVFKGRSKPMREVQDVPIAQIDVGAYTQRFALEAEGIDRLAASIRRLGVLVPLIVRPLGDRYQLVAGHRRLAAARKVALERVPCLIQDSAEAVSRESAFAENLFREDPTPVETAVAIAKAVAGGEADEKAVAEGMNRSVDWVRRQLAMLEWPEDVLQAIHGGKLSVAAASNLACIEEPQNRAFLLDNAVENGATARTTAAWLQAWRAAIPVTQALVAPVEAGRVGPVALGPQAPCLCCGVVHRTDELSHVPLCPPCIRRVRALGAGS
jgi:ParB/RepB/Spo0J family partition protein